MRQDTTKRQGSPGHRPGPPHAPHTRRPGEKDGDGAGGGGGGGVGGGRGGNDDVYGKVLT